MNNHRKPVEGDLLASVAEFLGGIGLSSRLDGLVTFDGVPTGTRALELADEVRALIKSSAPKQST